MSDSPVMPPLHAATEHAAHTTIAELSWPLPRPSYPDVTELIAQQACVVPHQTAVVEGDHTVTYTSQRYSLPLATGPAISSR